MSRPIVCKKLTRRYGKDKALSSFCHAFPRRGLVMLLGHSGSGKTTLLNILAGLDAEYSGSVKLFGREIKNQDQPYLRKMRLTRIGYVFQSFRLLESETVLSNVLFQAKAIYDEPKDKLVTRANDALRFVGMEKKERQTVNTLSGGEKQRVAIARAIVNDPALLLADEPTGALDEKNGEAVFALLKQIAKTKLVVVVTHDEGLARRFGDEILRLKDGCLVEEKKKEISAKREPISMIALSKRRAKPRLPFLFLLVHAFHTLKAKKARSLLFLSSTIMALTGLGISLFLSTELSKQIDHAFSSLVPPNSIVMSPRGEGSPPIGNIYSAGLSECEYLVNEYPDLVKDYGSTLTMSYEEWFADANEFRYLSGATSNVLPSFSMRSINDFLWLDDYPDSYVYPRRPVKMEVDDLVLGLPYQSMWTLCLSLHIERTYQSLGDYLSSKPMPLYLYASNEAFGFYDEEVFSLIGVMESPYPVIYHLHHRWNKEIILDHMRFRSSLMEDTPSPQYAYEIPYVEILSSFEELLYLVRRDENLSHLVLDPCSGSYLPSLCTSGEDCDIGRYYLYQADKNGISFPDLDKAMTIASEIIGRQIVSSGGYYADASSLMMGFMNKAFLCDSEESATSVIDAYSRVPSSFSSSLWDIPKGVKDGSFLSSGGDSFRLSSDLRDFSFGGPPEGIEEIGLSEGLYQELGSPESVYFVYERSQEEIGDYVERDFGYMELKVTGTKKEEGSVVYACSDWTVDALLSGIKMNPFVLEPYGAVFAVSDLKAGEAAIAKLTSAFPEYRFANPAKEVSKSVEKTLQYVSTVLLAFSAVALFSSLSLFCIVMAITITENQGEILLFEAMGFSPQDTASSFACHCLLYLGVSLLISSLTMVGLELFVSFFLSSIFQSPFSFSLSPFPFLTILGVAVLFYLLLRIVIGFYINKKVKTRS